MFTLQSFKEDTLAADITDSATSATLTTGAFGTPTGEQMLVIDYDVSAKREIVKCAIDGTAVTSIDRAQDGTAAVAHSSGAKVIMAFVPSHYKALTDFVGARAYLTDTLGTTVSGALTKVALDAETYDVGANFADGKFVAPVNGYYSIDGAVYFQNAVTGKYYASSIAVDGAAKVTVTQSYVTTTAGGVCVPVHHSTYLAAGSYVELYYIHDGGTAVDLYGGTGSTWMSVHLIKEV